MACCDLFITYSLQLIFKGRFIQGFYMISVNFFYASTYTESYCLCFHLYTINLEIFDTYVQVNNYEIFVNFFHISHNLTWYSAIVHKITRIYPVQLMNWLNNLCKFVQEIVQLISKRITCKSINNKHTSMSK